jgi:hypothetical protein
MVMEIAILSGKLELGDPNLASQKVLNCFEYPLSLSHRFRNKFEGWKAPRPPKLRSGKEVELFKVQMPLVRCRANSGVSPEFMGIPWGSHNRHNYYGNL